MLLSSCLIGCNDSVNPGMRLCATTSFSQLGVVFLTYSTSSARVVQYGEELPSIAQLTNKPFICIEIVHKSTKLISN